MKNLHREGNYFVCGGRSFKNDDSKVLLAQQFAIFAHDGQYRRNGCPYYYHPLKVAQWLDRRGENETVLVAAALHDVLEDTEVTAKELREVLEFSDDVVNAVVCLTKVKGENYETYLERVKANLVARKVKIADIIHNLSDFPTEKQINKYIKALIFLYE